MIKLIATDIDGTLIEEGQNILKPRLNELILELKGKGILFVAASARQYPSLQNLFKEVKDEIIYVSENGAYVIYGNEVIDEIIVDKEYVSDLIIEMRELKDCSFFTSVKDKVYTESKDGDFVDLLESGYGYEVSVVDDLLSLSPSLNVMKISLYRKGGIDEIADTIVQKWQDRLQVTVSGESWLDCVDLRSDKGHAMEKIQKVLGIKPEETMVFGDNINDLGMFEKAKYSYAVGNAREEVKAVASHITDTNVNDGVIKVLETLI